MSIKDNLREILIALGLIIILIFLMNPMDLYYSNMMLLSSLTILIILFIFFSIFIWKDKSVDEREELHQHLASRSAYLIGSGIMLLGIIVQSLEHAIDIWLVIALIGMIISKIVVKKWSANHR